MTPLVTNEVEWQTVTESVSNCLDYDRWSRLGGVSRSGHDPDLPSFQLSQSGLIASTRS